MMDSHQALVAEVAHLQSRVNELTTRLAMLEERTVKAEAYMEVASKLAEMNGKFRAKVLSIDEPLDPSIPVWQR